MKKKNETISTIITVTIVATIAVVTTIAAVSYILYDKFIKLRQISYEPDVDDDMFEDSVESLETMIVCDEDEEI